jgi:hypothetical protein
MFEATEIEYESIVLDPADDWLIQSAERSCQSIKRTAFAARVRRAQRNARTRKHLRR